MKLCLASFAIKAERWKYKMQAGFQDLRQTSEYANYMQSIGWIAVEIRSPKQGIGNFLYIKKLPLVTFSVAKLQRPVGPIDWKLVEKARKKYRIIKLETRETVAKKSLWIDLTKSESSLLAEMKPKTRYNIGLAQRRGVKVKLLDGTELSRSLPVKESFFNLLRQNARRLKIFAVPKKWFEAQLKAFGKKCFVTLAYLGDELAAGNFFMTSKNAGFYSHNGSTALGRKVMGPTLATWAGILEAKKRGLKTFDFDGIYDGSRLLKRWQGFSKFKQGFGGKEVNFGS